MSEARVRRGWRESQNPTKHVNAPLFDEIRPVYCRSVQRASARCTLRQ